MNRPYKAFCHIILQIFDVLPTGELSGVPVKSIDLKQKGIDPTKILLTVDGLNLDDCIAKLRKKIQAFNEA